MLILSFFFFFNARLTFSLCLWVLRFFLKSVRLLINVTLTGSGINYYSPLHGVNSSVEKLLALNRNTWSYITVRETNKYHYWMGGCCTIHWLHLCRGVRPPPTSVLFMTLNNQKVRFQWHWSIWVNLEYAFIAIAPRSTLNRSGSTW